MKRKFIRSSEQSDFIAENTTKIRDLIRHPWKINKLTNDKVTWNKLISSLDVIDDTNEAISYFFSLDSFSSSTGGYLYLYGLLQALYMQQDALKSLSIALYGKEINWRKDYPDLYSIRELRNDSIGHPTDRGNNKSFHFITKHSVSNGSFSLISHDYQDERPMFRRIHLLEIRNKQEACVNEFLNKIIDAMNQERKEFMENLSPEKISDLIPKDIGYQLSKVYEGVYSNHSLAPISFAVIKETIVQIKEAIRNKYGKIETLPGLFEVIRKMDYIINKIDGWQQEKKLFENSDAEVFLDSFSVRLEELKIMLKEIDDDK